MTMRFLSLSFGISVPNERIHALYGVPEMSVGQGINRSRWLLSPDARVYSYLMPACFSSFDELSGS